MVILTVSVDISMVIMSVILWSCQLLSWLCFYWHVNRIIYEMSVDEIPWHANHLVKFTDLVQVGVDKKITRHAMIHIKVNWKRGHSTLAKKCRVVFKLRGLLIGENYTDKRYKDGYHMTRWILPEVNQGLNERLYTLNTIHTRVVISAGSIFRMW